MDVSCLLRESMKSKPASNRSARQKTSTPRDVTRMNFNENAYGMADSVKQVILDAALESFMYQDFFAVDIKEKLGKFYGLTKDHVLVGSGTSAIIDMLGEIFINYGDEVVYCMPTYGAFCEMVNDNGGVRVEVPLDADYCYDLDAMRAAVTDRTKMVVVVNPNNPTGTCVNAARVEAFIRSLPAHVLAVVDEAYYEYVDDPSHYSMIRLIQEGYDRPLIVLHTFSKIYGLAGLRIGYAIADPLLVDEMMKACQAWNVGRNALLAAEAALDDQDYVRMIREKNVRNRQYLTGALREMGCFVVEPAANFIYFDTHRDSREVWNRLAAQKILISAPDSFNRVTVGTEEQNAAFVQAMRQILEELPPRTA